jgi:hypothetical protein
MSQAQLARLQKGHTIRLTKDQLRDGPIGLHLRPRQLKKVETARRKQKGLEIHLEPGESVVTVSQGGSMLGMARSLYQSEVKPHVRGFLHRQASRATPMLRRQAESALTGVVGRTAARRVASAVDPAVHDVINRVGDATQAYGTVARRPNHGSGIRQDLRRVHRFLKPAIRAGLKTAARVAATSVGVPIAGELADRAVDAIGDASGGWGLPQQPAPKVPSAGRAVAKRGRARTVPRGVRSASPTVGGSFKPAGY